MKIIILSFAITSTIFVGGSLLFNLLRVFIKNSALHLKETTLQAAKDEEQ